MDLDDQVFNLSLSWQKIIVPIWAKHRDSIVAYLDDEQRRYEDKLKIIPRLPSIFDAFKFCRLKKLKVVIVGTEPYVDVPLAEGLAYSIPEKSKHLTTSLQAIYQELAIEFNAQRTRKSLRDWAKQGVLLLNMSLSVREYCNNSHVHIWRGFMEDLVTAISATRNKLVYMLWGFQSQRLRKLLDLNDNLILTSYQPTHLLWYGNHHFTMANAYLKHHRNVEIDWIGA